MEDKDVFYYVMDDCSCGDFQDAMDFVGNHASSYKDAIGWVIEVHKKHTPTHSMFVDGENIIEMLEQNACDNFSEYAEDYLGDIYNDKEKCKELEDLISNWLDKNAISPSFYQSGGQVGSIVVDRVLLDKHKIEFDN